MIFKKDSLLHDIGNLAYVIADVHEEAGSHALHQTLDICQEGNIDRVSRMLGLAFSVVKDILSPLLHDAGKCSSVHDIFAVPRDYRLKITAGISEVTSQRLATLVREFMVCHVLADWLSITLPCCVDVWRKKADVILEDIKSVVTEEVFRRSRYPVRRPLSPF